MSSAVEQLEIRQMLSAAPAPDLVAFAKQLDAAGAKLYGAAWDATTTAQRQLFGDGSQFLSFTEVTNTSHNPNQIAISNSITTYPTWIFADNTRLVGVQTLAALTAKTGIAVPLGVTPGFAPVATQTVLGGSPLMLPIDGFDVFHHDQQQHGGACRGVTSTGRSFTNFCRRLWRHAVRHV
jgi:hypothetical protein